VAHDPEACETGVDIKARNAHHLVVVPEHRRTLVIRIRVEHSLTGSGDVLRPAVAGGLRHGAVEVDNRIAGKRGGCRVGHATAPARARIAPESRPPRARTR